jgi:hypothetical protein
MLEDDKLGRNLEVCKIPVAPVEVKEGQCSSNREKNADAEFAGCNKGYVRVRVECVRKNAKRKCAEKGKCRM